MNDRPIVESIREFIKDCPYLPEYYHSLNIDRLDEDVSSYSINAVPCEPIVKKFVNGSSIRQFEFHLVSTEAYSQEVLDQIVNSTFFEHFSDWLEKCTISGILPELSGEKRTAQSIEATTHGYVLDTSETTAQYAIQCRLTYHQKR